MDETWRVGQRDQREQAREVNEGLSERQREAETTRLR